MASHDSYYGSDLLRQLTYKYGGFSSLRHTYSHLLPSSEQEQQQNKDETECWPDVAHFYGSVVIPNIIRQSKSLMMPPDYSVEMQALKLCEEQKYYLANQKSSLDRIANDNQKRRDEMAAKVARQKLIEKSNQFKTTKRQTTEAQSMIGDSSSISTIASTAVIVEPNHLETTNLPEASSAVKVNFNDSKNSNEDVLETLRSKFNEHVKLSNQTSKLNTQLEPTSNAVSTGADYFNVAESQAKSTFYPASVKDQESRSISTPVHFYMPKANEDVKQNPSSNGRPASAQFINYSEFEADTTPFDTVALQSVNDKKELEQIFMMTGNNTQQFEVNNKVHNGFLGNYVMDTSPDSSMKQPNGQFMNNSVNNKNHPHAFYPHLNETQSFGVNVQRNDQKSVMKGGNDGLFNRNESSGFNTAHVYHNGYGYPFSPPTSLGQSTHNHSLSSHSSVPHHMHLGNSPANVTTTLTNSTGHPITVNSSANMTGYNPGAFSAYFPMTRSYAGSNNVPVSNKHFVPNSNVHTFKAPTGYNDNAAHSISVPRTSNTPSVPMCLDSSVPMSGPRSMSPRLDSSERRNLVQTLSQVSPAKVNQSSVGANNANANVSMNATPSHGSNGTATEFAGGGLKSARSVGDLSSLVMTSLPASEERKTDYNVYLPMSSYLALKK